MDLTQLVKLITDSGFGILSFAALLYGGWKVLLWLDEVKTNDLVHITEALTKIQENTREANKKMDEQNIILNRVDKNTTK